jgi:hypothetical protein
VTKVKLIPSPPPPQMKKGNERKAYPNYAMHIILAFETTSYKTSLSRLFFWGNKQTNKISSFILLKNLSKHDSAAATTSRNRKQS